MWLSELRVALPDRVVKRGSVRIEDGLIAEVIDGAPARARHAVDGRGLTLMPGIVDIHGDMLERELEPRPGTFFPVELALHQLDARLAMNGITTAYAAISLGDGPLLRSEERARELIRAVNRFRDALGVDMRVHARFEVSVPEGTKVLEDALKAGHVHMVSLMDHTPGQGQFRDLEFYVDYMTRWLGGDREQAQRTAQAGLETPVSWEVAREITRLARERSVPIASHDDDTRHKVDVMADLGTHISEFPVTLEAAQEAKRRGMFVVMGAPNALRGGSHSGNLSAREAIGAGAMDLLCADYHPASMLQSAFKLAEDGQLPFEESVRLVTYNAARAAGLEDRGRIEIGARADLILIEDGHTPRVRATLRSGRVIYSDGRVRGLERDQARAWALEPSG